MPCAVRTKSRAPELGTCRLHALLIHTELDVPPTWLLKTKLIHIQEQACSIRQESEGRTMVFNHLSREEFWQSTGLPCPGALVVKNLPAKAGDTRDTGSIPGLGRPLWRREWQPLKYSYLENPMGRVAWLAIIHGVRHS